MPGTTTFIMGASGAGKTSLLNMLSDRISQTSGSKLSGDVFINDSEKLNQEVFGRIAGYVMQDDILFQYYTPKEALTFAARLKLRTSFEE
jgi:ABC-type multidrug transport system ATPase subunit